MPIVLQFCSFDSFAGRAIQWFTQSTVGHVDTVVKEGLLGAQAMDNLGCVGSGVQIRAFDYGGMKNRIRVTLNVSQPIADTYERFVRDQLGKPYDLTAIGGFVTDREWKESDSWFCSELVAAGLDYAHAFPFRLIAPANKITPGELLLVCSSWTGDIVYLGDA